MRKIITMVMTLFFLSACTTAVAGTSTVTKPTATKQPAWTSAPTWTLTSTSTALPTLAPMLTPSPGPAPDVEFVNVNIQGERANTGWFIGEIRNNSEKTLFFNSTEYNYQFLIDFHDWVIATDGSFITQFVLRDFSIRSSLAPYAENAPCYLFPGETGVMSFDIYKHCLREGEHCHVVEEYTTEPPEGVGFQLISSEIGFRTWDEFLKAYGFENYPKEFNPDLHIQVDNVEYEIIENETAADADAILVRFDIDYKKPEFWSITNTAIWVVLYDESDTMINVLHNPDMAFCPEENCLKDKRYRIIGAGCNTDFCRLEAWTEPGGMIQWLKPGLQLTSADLQRVDHIRILIEMQDMDVCHSTVLWQTPSPSD